MKITFSKISLARTSALLVLFISLIYYLLQFEYIHKNQVIRSDGFGYYSYVQGTLLRGDIRNTFYAGLDLEDKKRIWLYEGKEGAYLPKMTMGLAYAWTPGFYLAHLLADIFNYPQDGWSAPYQWAVAITGILFLLIGAWACWRILRLYFDWWVSVFTLLSIVYSTNLLYYGVLENSMSHVYSFALIALYVWNSELWLRNFRHSNLLVMALLLGWITLIRPTNGIVVFCTPILHFAHGGKLAEILRWELLLASIIALIPVFPQLAFWRETTGQWLYYSYDNESFFFLNPSIIKGLFSYRNGLFLYTPLLILAIFGLRFLWSKQRQWFWTATVMVAMHIYITFSWWCWYYGDSLSIRPMVDFYIFFSLPLAAFVNTIWQKSAGFKLLILVMIFTLAWNNLNQIKLYTSGTITGSTMAATAFRHTFFRSGIDGNLNLLGGAYREPDIERLRLGLPERIEYDTTIVAQLGEAQFDATLSKENPFSPAFVIPISEFSSASNDLIEVKITLQCDDFSKSQLMAVFTFDNGDELLTYNAINLNYANLKDGALGSVNLYERIPRETPEDARFNVYLWMQGASKAHLKKVEAKAIDVKFKESTFPEN